MNIFKNCMSNLNLKPINFFSNHRLIVRAIKPVKAGEEVMNCYGPHFRHHR